MSQSVTEMGLPTRILKICRSRLQGLAKGLVLGSLAGASSGVLRIRDVDGEEIVLGGSDGSETQPTATLIVHDSERFWTRALLSGDIGFAQSYMLHEISTPDLTGVFEFFVRNASAESHISPSASMTWGAANALASIFRGLGRRANDIANAKLNAQAHYSLSNPMFAAFLSEDMTYSAPLWRPISAYGGADGPIESLEAAQASKLRYAIAAAHIKASDHVLEIGTGWGSFALTAARETGCRVTTVTPSAAQKALAEKRFADAGLSNRIKVVLADYREIWPPASSSSLSSLFGSGGGDSQHEPFDKLVSIEMIEHVGHDFLPTYFACVDRYLKRDGGIAYLQCITMPETRYADYLRGGDDFIKRYIFPGGHLPTVSALVAAIDAGSHGRLIVDEIKSFGGHYCRALRMWCEQFMRNFDAAIVPALREAHPDMTPADIDIFKRKWEYYFCYCEAGFRTKSLGDVGITVAREGCVELLEDLPM